MKVHHIGYLVKNMEESISSFEDLGYKMDSKGIIHDESRNIQISFLKNGEYSIELVCPLSEKSVVYGTLKKIGNGPYHICYEVANLEKAEKEFRCRGYLPVVPKEVAVAIECRRVLFMVNRHIGLIELVEEK